MRKFLATRIKKLWAELALLSVELIIILILFFLAIIGFAYLAYEVFHVKKDVIDFKIFDFLTRYVTDLNTDIMVFITFFATHTFLIPANLLLIAYFLFIKRHRWYSIKVPVVAIGSVVIMSSLKLFFSRPRPLTPLLEAVRGFSFPSGHAMSSVTFYGLLMYIVWHEVANKALKWSLIVLLALFILAIGFSRVYLRVHYASDVLAGFAMGAIWLVISLWAVTRIEKFTRKEIAPQISGVGIKSQV
jgi:membrane-associated phospholipid phosphatase